MTLPATRAGRAFGCALLLPALALGGCRCSDDRPYTPFGVASSLPATPSAAPSASASASAAPDTTPPPQKAVLAPRGSTRWQLGGREIAAPSGYVFEQAITADFDGDGGDDHVAWLGSASERTPRPAGEAWYFPARGEPKKLAGLPGFVPQGPHCTLGVSLLRTGPRTVTLDARASCSGSVIERSPVRGLVVLAPAHDRPEILTLRAAAPAPGETLELGAVTSDRDGDGRDDVDVHVTVGAGERAPLSAPFVWLDRAAGPSRDTAEPKKTLERLASRELQRAKQKKLAADVVERVGALRRLLSSSCAEGATPRVFDADGNGLRCGDLGGVVDALGTAETSAELARGRTLEAFGALARDGWYFGSLSVAARKRIEKSLLAAVEPLVATVKVFDVQPHLPAAPRYSPLAFEPDGALSVRTPSGLARIEPGASEAVPVELDGEAPRPLEVVTSSGATLVGVSYSCNRSEVALLLREQPASGVTEVVTGLLAPRPGACGRSPRVPTTVFAPIGERGATDVVVLLGGTTVGGAGAPPRIPQGSARSRDGRWLAMPSSFGVLVSGEVTRLLHLPPEAGSAASLTDCVPANDGRKVACVSGRRVLVARASE